MTYHLNRIGSSESDTIFKQLCNSSLLRWLPFLACIGCKQCRDMRLFLNHKNHTFLFHGRKALSVYISKILEYISPAPLTDAATSDESMIYGGESISIMKSTLVITGISGSGKSHMTAALVYYLTCKRIQSSDKYRVVYIASVIAFSMNSILYLRYALLIAFFSDLSDDEKKVIKKCYTSKDFTRFLHNMKMNKLLNIVFIVDQFDAFDSDKFMKDGTCTNQQKIDAKLMLQSVMSDFKKVFVLSQSDGCTNSKAGNDDLFNQYIDLSEPLDQVSACYALCCECSIQFLIST